jgi:hypothetical protein
MMRHKYTISEYPDFKHGTTAITINGFPFVSEGRNSYWVYIPILDVVLYIDKEHKYGKELANFISNKTLPSLVEAEAFTYKILMEQMSVADFRKFLAMEFSRGRVDGENSLRVKFLELLNLDT